VARVGGAGVLYHDITGPIGNTPFRGWTGRRGLDGTDVYAKLEICNLFGSVKPRTHLRPSRP